MRNFVLCSACAGFVGVLEAVRTSSVQPDPSGANDVLFDGISAAVIGGTLLAGGSGTVVGALIGALFLGVLRDGLIIKGVNADYLSFYLGLAIIIAMAANTTSAACRGGGRPVADEVLRVENVAKRFGPVIALRDINLRLRKGEVLGLLGDNGAGKSTLMKIICGFEKPDEGQMLLRGEPYEPKSVDNARALGIDAVYQDLALIDELSVFQNMFLRREKLRWPLPFLANRVMRKEARAALDEIGVRIPRLERAGRAAVRRAAAGDRGRADRALRCRHAAARRAARGDGGQGGRADPRPDRADQARGPGLDDHGPAQLRARPGELRPGQPDPGRRHHARQADVGDLGRGADRDRRRRVPACARQAAQAQGAA